MKALKIIGKILGVLVGLIVIALIIIYFTTSRTLDATHEVTVNLVDLPSDSTSLAEGQRMSVVHGCVACHGENYGGQVLIDAPPFMVAAPNLTRGRGGIGSTYTDTDWQRVLRHGVKPDGHGVLIMPSEYYTHLSDTDLGGLISYLKTVPAVDNELPPSELKLLGRIIMATGGLSLASDMIDQERAARPNPGVTPGPTVEYGGYFASTSCVACHAGDLHGGPSPDPASPPGPDLAAAATWSLEDFKHALRTGMRPSGQEMNPAWMPWEEFAHLTDMELEAIHNYVKATAGQ
jgi:cytochrome c553